VWDRWKEALCQIPARFVQSFRYNTGLWRTDGRTRSNMCHCVSMSPDICFSWHYKNCLLTYSCKWSWYSPLRNRLPSMPYDKSISCVTSYNQQTSCYSTGSERTHCLANNTAFSVWHCWLGVRKSIQPVKIKWWDVGVVICLERGADCLHMVQLMPLHPKTPSSLASFKSRLDLPFWYRLTRLSWKHTHTHTHV